MGAFAVASVVGVPAGLELARLGGWRMPFLAVAGLGVVLAATAILVLPPIDLHLRARPQGSSRPGAALGRPTAQLALVATAVVMTAQFALVPNIPAYWQFNLGYPRERLGLLFIVGGAVSFAVMRAAGWLADRAGAAITAAAATLAFVAVLLAAFVFPAPRASALALFVGFMATSSLRMVPMQALFSRVPENAERAGFMSAQSVAQHLGSAAGAFLSSRMLRQLPDGRLGGMEGVASLAAALAAVVPLLLWLVEIRVRRRERERGARNASLERRAGAPRRDDASVIVEAAEMGGGP
jgi:predicted MFS family arabinose efflux permease